MNTSPSTMKPTARDSGTRDGDDDPFAEPEPDPEEAPDEAAPFEAAAGGAALEGTNACLHEEAGCAAGAEQLAEWIEAIVDHDERALAALYDATLSRVYGIVLRVVRKTVLAEEVVEDTYYQVWRQAARFDAARGTPLSWLLGMARSRAIDAMRREARFQHEDLDDGCALETANAASTIDDLLDVARGHAELHRALMLLNAQPRQLVALAFFRGLSHEEIATQTCLPLGTVKSQIRRALLMLRQMLGEGGLPAWAS